MKKTLIQKRCLNAFVFCLILAVESICIFFLVSDWDLYHAKRDDFEKREYTFQAVDVNGLKARKYYAVSVLEEDEPLKARSVTRALSSSLNRLTPDDRIICCIAETAGDDKYTVVELSLGDEVIYPFEAFQKSIRSHLIFEVVLVSLVAIMLTVFAVVGVKEMKNDLRSASEELPEEAWLKDMTVYP